jgi:steroid 5-alpha reductase family enzyme
MTPDLILAAQGLAVALLLMALVWVGSLATDDASLVDRFWGMSFVVLAWFYAAMASGGAGWFRALAVGLVSVWGVRLSLHITWRNWGHGEDPRYAAMREGGGPGWRWRSLATVFGFQALLAWVIAMPLLVAFSADGPPVLLLVVLGVTCWLVGFVFEAGGDWQLARFKADPANRGAVLDSGLWRYTRHPNYFCDAMCWWGFWLLGTSAGGWWTLFAPVLMTVLLMKVSGVTLLERNLVDAKPAYRDYIRRTNAFIPGPPRG